MSADSGVRSSWVGESALVAELQLMMLPPQRRKRALGQMGREVKKQSRKNVRKQSDVNGRSFTDRHKTRTKKGKMLSGFVRGSNIRQKTKDNAVSIGFKNEVMGKMARAHQEGQTITMHSKPMSEKRRGEWEEDEASMEQADAMIRLGFKRKTSSGVEKPVSRIWIVENYTKWRALGILYTLNNKRQGKKTWQVKLPAREFFSNDAKWVKAMAFDVVKAELAKGRN